MDKTSLIDLVNWPAVLAAPRRAGGHIEVMEAIFKGTAEVLASWVDEDYQDGEAFACRFPGGQVAIMTDGFGSCSGAAGANVGVAAIGNSKEAMLAQLAAIPTIRTILDGMAEGLKRELGQ